MFLEVLGRGSVLKLIAVTRPRLIMHYVKLADLPVWWCRFGFSVCQAAFLLPVLTAMLRNGVEGSAFSVVQEPQAIIVGPTRELVTQIHHEAHKFAFNTIIRPVVVYGGVTSSHQAREVGKGAHMVIGTPGRMIDFIRRGYVSGRYFHHADRYQIHIVVFDLFLSCDVKLSLPVNRAGVII